MWNPLQRPIESGSQTARPRTWSAIESFRVPAFIFLAVLIVGLLLTLPSIRAPFYWDDLHQVRVYTPAELARGWFGRFDPDYMEDPGFRPLTMYFEHFRALAFGENTAAHRVFLLVLFAIFLVLVGVLARWLFAMSPPQLVLAALLALLHVDNVYHYFWITDGIYLVPGILVMGAILSFLRALGSGRWIWLLSSLLCTVLALLTREDALVVYPLLIWFGLVFVLMHRQDGRAFALRKLDLGLFTALMLLAGVGFWYWRSLAVPESRPLNVDFMALLWGIAQTVQNVGDHQKLAVPWPNYDLLVWAWRVWLLALLAMGLVAVKGPARRTVLAWSGAIVIAALPAMVVARINVLLIPATFWGFLVAFVVGEFWRRFSAPAWRLAASALILFALAAPAYGSFVFQQDLRTNSLEWMATSAKLLYNYAGHIATIPPARRAAVQEQLAAYGISGLADLDSRWQRLNRRAIAEQMYGANQAGLPFLPRFNFMPAFKVR